MLFSFTKFFLQGSFDGVGLVSPALSKETPQNSFVAKTLWAGNLLALSSVAQLATGCQPYFEMSRLAQNSKCNPAARTIFMRSVPLNSIIPTTHD